jgi:transitional endoplasmic reticulum ATPase
LLYGPTGTGKKLIAKAIAVEGGLHFISIAGPEVISRYYGESEQRIREVFEKPRENALSIILIDELESIAQTHKDKNIEDPNIENSNNKNTSYTVERRVIAQLLTMMDGLEERGNVVVIGNGQQHLAFWAVLQADCKPLNFI